MRAPHRRLTRQNNATRGVAKPNVSHPVRLFFTRHSRRRCERVACMLRYSHPLWNASAETKGGSMPSFADSLQKSVTIATFFERSAEKRSNGSCPPICMYPENLVKISPVHSEIIGLQGDR